MEPTVISVVLAVCLAVSEILSVVPKDYIQANSILGVIVTEIRAIAAYAKGTQESSSATSPLLIPASLDQATSSQPIDIPTVSKT